MSALTSCKDHKRKVKLNMVVGYLACDYRQAVRQAWEARKTERRRRHFGDLLTAEVYEAEKRALRRVAYGLRDSLRRIKAL